MPLDKTLNKGYLTKGILKHSMGADRHPKTGKNDVLLLPNGRCFGALQALLYSLQPFLSDKLCWSFVPLHSSTFILSLMGVEISATPLCIKA